MKLSERAIQITVVCRCIEVHLLQWQVCLTRAWSVYVLMVKNGRSYLRPTCSSGLIFQNLNLTATRASCTLWHWSRNVVRSVGVRAEEDIRFWVQYPSSTVSGRVCAGISNLEDLLYFVNCCARRTGQAGSRFSRPLIDPSHTHTHTHVLLF